jgi:hypothetical protein
VRYLFALGGILMAIGVTIYWLRERPVLIFDPAYGPVAVGLGVAFVAMLVGLGIEKVTR